MQHILAVIPVCILGAHAWTKLEGYNPVHITQVAWLYFLKAFYDFHQPFSRHLKSM